MSHSWHWHLQGAYVVPSIGEDQTALNGLPHSGHFFCSHFPQAFVIGSISPPHSRHLPQMTFITLGVSNRISASSSFILSMPKSFAANTNTGAYGPFLRGRPRMVSFSNSKSIQVAMLPSFIFSTSSASYLNLSTTSCLVISISRCLGFEYSI